MWKWLSPMALVLAICATATARGASRWYGSRPSWSPRRSGELTIAEMRKLGLTDDQILKICEKRRDLEKERERLQKEHEAARAAAAAANPRAAELSRQLNSLATSRIEEIYRAVMNDTQFKAYRRLRYLEEARNWLRGYRSWLKLTDTQVEDIANLLVPVFEKYEAMSGELDQARRQLAELRRAESIDIRAIEEAEKRVAELSQRNIWQLRQQELMERMRAGLTADQLDRLDRVRRP